MDAEFEQGGITNRQGDIQPFHQRFNIKINAEEAQRRFLNRVSNIIPDIVQSAYTYEYHKELFLRIANKLGLRFTEQDEYEQFSTGDFYKELELLEAAYESISADYYKGKFADGIRNIISESEIDLGIRWSDEYGIFLPAGARLLDHALVNENLKWLAENKYEGVRLPLEKGLHFFLEAHKKPEKLADVITDVYEALEALAKVVTGKERDLSKNAELFISELSLSNHYKKMLKDYISYACDYRHAVGKGRTKTPPKRNEVEAFIYTTGLFIRLAIQQLAIQT